MDTPLPDFGRYKALEYLGAGSYGEVYKVVDTEDGSQRPYALKWIQASAPSEAKRRFENEVWALNQLDHPAIPKYVAVGQAAGRSFLVMTYARGESLRKVYKRQCEEIQPCGLHRMLAILHTVLEALTHMHSKGICHRDVKDDNILSDASTANVTLLDLGFCRGPGQPHEHQTFWNAGAGRYSPPQKLEFPSQANATHDVFAAGVVAYLLLTNQYPWDGDDVGLLREKMKNEPLRPISEHNRFVLPEVSRLLCRLLDLDDNTRPSAQQALELVEQARSMISGLKSVVLNRSIAFSRVIRDPIHGDIRMTEYEWSILSTAEMQRLRWIRQLGFTNLVYPGAEHSRLSHSLGAMHVADKILRAVEERTGTQLEPERRLAARLFALVHDVTHVPFGHTLEDELQLFGRHDANSSRAVRLVLSDSSALGNALADTEYGRAIRASFDSSTSLQRLTYLHELLSGPVGADVLDYIDRDSYFCGLDHRVDSALYRRFNLTQLRGDEAQDMPHLISRLYSTSGIRLDAEFSLESMLLTRFSLFMKVYTHPVKAAAGAMLGKALALEMEKSKGRQIELDLEQLGDVELLVRLRKSRTKGVAELAEAIHFRRLFKLVYRADVLAPNELDSDSLRARKDVLEKSGLFNPQSRDSIETDLAKKGDVARGDVAVYCTPRPPGLQGIQQYVERTPGTSNLLDEAYKPFARIRERHLSLWRVYAFVSPAIDETRRRKLADACVRQFNRENQLGVGRRQGHLFHGT